MAWQAARQHAAVLGARGALLARDACTPCRVLDATQAC
jgi:hypothetical protein